MEGDELLVPISAIEHWSYCPRQCALIHVEGAWADNQLTVEGHQLHELVDLPGLEQRPGIRKVRAMPLRCDRLSLVGRADLVVFYQDPGYPGTGRPYPVEYKRGLRLNFEHADLQLCAQALCLEEMLQVPVLSGAIYYGKSRKRREVEFKANLRNRTERIIESISLMIAELRTPAPDYGPKCEKCSLQALCVPTLPDRVSLLRYMDSLEDRR